MTQPLTLETIYPWFEARGYRGLTELPEVEVTEEVYDHFLNILPPIYVPGGFCVPEPVAHSEADRPIVARYRTRGVGQFTHDYMELGK